MGKKHYDASDPEQIRKAELAADDQDKDIDYILARERGRRWLYNLIWEQCHHNLPSHTPGDTHSTAFNEGARSVGNTVEELIKRRSPKMYFKMLEENHFND